VFQLIWPASCKVSEFISIGLVVAERVAPHGIEQVVFLGRPPNGWVSRLNSVPTGTFIDSGESGFGSNYS
jgi:hypothetical protein